MLWYRCISSPLGEITLYSDGTHLVGLRFRDGTDPERTADAEDRPLAVFDRTEEWLDLYFSVRIPPFAPPLKIDASPFRTAVYEALLEIPYGQTASYAAIARMLVRRGKRAACSARAVGSALARNPILLIVPCHRVIGSDGSLTGYAAGVERKRRLLQIETDPQEFKKIEKCC
jgi:methylated-DNA-[protein]-cysteine S-methyltransferase